VIANTQHKTTTYRAAGKLMLFGEYLVLKGAKSLAFPLKYGQTLEVSPSENMIHWESWSPEGCWFKATFEEDLNLWDTNDHEVAETLRKLLKLIRDLNPKLDMKQNFKMTADFNLQWGFGSSSTFISLLAQWSDAYAPILLKESFGGSGYDVACATADGPIIYQLKEGGGEYGEVPIHENIQQHMLFVYLGKKQSSKNEIARFRQGNITETDLKLMDEIVDRAIEADAIEKFEALLDQSEDILAPIIGRTKLKEDIFADYKYSIKSLGAWGGDFFLATFRDLEEAKDYFKTKGHQTMFTYNELIING
jgi:mevalonate kinase